MAKVVIAHLSEMNTVNLPFDVLHAIISSLDDKATALAVSLTCRTLRGLAIRRLLSILPINLKDQETVHALHKFLFANESARIQSLRKLNISIRSVDKPYSAEETVQCLVDILKHATRLEWLALCTFADDGLFDDFPQVLDAICELSSLWELVVDGDWSSPVRTIVRRVRSPLKVLHIRPNGIHLPEQTFWIDPSHHESLLSQRLAFSLEELHMEGAALWYPLGYKGVQFPGVRSVFLGYHGGPQWMETFLHMFPALNGTFDTGDLEFDEGALLKANLAEQRRVRALNKQSQEIRTWKYLDRVIGDTHALYMLALACPVRHLVVKQVCGHRKEQVADILRDTQPTCLNISIRLSHGLRIFEDLFPPEATPVLTHLVLVVFYENFDTHVGNLNPCCHGDAHEIQWIALLSAIRSSIGDLRLSHLRLVLCYKISAAASPPTSYSRDLVVRIRELDQQAVAAELLDTIPSLRSVVITTNGCFDQVNLQRDDKNTASGSGKQVTRGWFLRSSAWSTTELDGTPVSPPCRVRRLPDCAVDPFVRSECLTLHSEDKFWMHDYDGLTEEEKADWPRLPE